jgi:hypothetical protein
MPSCRLVLGVGLEPSLRLFAGGAYVDFEAEVERQKVTIYCDTERQKEQLLDEMRDVSLMVSGLAAPQVVNDIDIIWGHPN